MRRSPRPAHRHAGPGPGDALPLPEGKELDFDGAWELWERVNALHGRPAPRADGGQPHAYADTVPAPLSD